MAVNRPLELDSTTNELKEITPIATSSGAGDASKLVQTDSGGKLDITLMPSGIGADTVSVTASEALAAGDWVNIYDNAGTKNVRKANATDNTKPAHGFVRSSVSNGATATVYLTGVNDQIPVGSFVAADVGKNVFLSTTGGGTTLTAPSSTGNRVQRLGQITDKGVSTISVPFANGHIAVIKA